MFCSSHNSVCDSSCLSYHFESCVILPCSSVLFADPTDEEEQLASGIVTVVVTSDDKLAAVHKPGRLIQQNKIYDQGVIVYIHTFFTWKCGLNISGSKVQ